ncbi:hypothetical protein A2642_04140 [Candidatus Nomurabacteria bacterium RIFCSPHIGHO2_01_FULL_39_10]|uniref:Biopterin-dependent aromatic amino acid hydroxylase family profile domain-containing protein n=1 Tax=Candidatus Nomurabacteria bacterium RIFCSPHIGHO2_01_FULL_39_10 TaxID=1801733 RepID=A0A1F6V873_9BACT|nr:MAG: hypothetical protein A2642_04140 [Candidatus Nomurabacteria bacterium RIFCSPHIGHO2_01_FULL_39_10]
MSSATLIQPLHTLPILDLDHPGAHDQEYRKRREIITNAALEFHAQQSLSLPLVEYTTEEHKVWQHVYKKLKHLHDKHASSLYNQGRTLLNLPQNHIPQLAHLSEQLQQLSNFHLEPIHGLVDARIFLSKLANNTMLCTQYIRHPSKPEFTPEPDIIHEVLGHVPLFTNPQLNKISQLIGKAAISATKSQLLSLTRLYWYTIEYGLIKEHNQIKALGAGLLGGIHDLQNAFSGHAIHKPFNMQEIINTDFNYSFEQPHFFVIPSLDNLQTETEQLIKSF